MLTEQYLRREYVDRRRSSTELATETGCTHKTVLRYLARFGIPARGRGRPPLLRDGSGPGGAAPSHESRLTAAFLVHSYLIRGCSTVEIAGEVGCGPTTVARYLRRHGIPLRARGGASRAA